MSSVPRTRLLWGGAVVVALGLVAAVVLLRGSPTSAVENTGTATASTEPCGPEEALAVREALTAMPPDPDTGADWSPSPVDGNYDPCAELSTVLVTVERGTGSSPMHALIFHRGRYLGTATSKAYGFTALDGAASTGDTVVLNYRSGQSCTACGDGVVTAVRYQWDGQRVQMLDPPPG